MSEGATSPSSQPSGSTAGVAWTTLSKALYRMVDLCPVAWSSALTAAYTATADAEFGGVGSPAGAPNSPASLRPVINFDDYFKACAPNGGPIALLRDERKVSVAMRQQTRVGAGVTEATPMIRILSSSGRLISQIPWRHKGLVKLGWTTCWGDKEALVAVMDNGNVIVQDIFGLVLAEFSLGEVARADGIADCIIFNRGLVARTAGRFQLLAVMNLKHPQVLRLPDPQLQKTPYAMAALDPSSSFGVDDSLLTVFLATDTGSVLKITPKSISEHRLPIADEPSPFTYIKPSSDGRRIALFSAKRNLYVTNSDFSSVIVRLPIQLKETQFRLSSVEFCGEAAVSHWDALGKTASMLLMVGPDRDFAPIAKYNSPLLVVPEIDGLRIISDSKCEFLQEVPEAVQDVLHTGSNTPAAKLFRAKDYYDNQSVRADEIIRDLQDKGELEDAVETCMRAAAHELHVPSQKALLQAASFGKLFLHCTSERYSPDAFVELCQTLRVLNALRSPSVGIPITYAQYEKLEVHLIIERLKNQRNYLLAFRLCKYLRAPADHVLTAWAADKIRSASTTTNFIPDDQLLNLIVSKFKLCPGLSFAEPALVAHAVKRTKLAMGLLDYEPKTQAQINLLSKIGAREAALDKALAALDSTAVYEVLFELLEDQTYPFAQFCQLINERPLARNLFVSYCKQANLNLLKEFYYTTDQPYEAANVIVRQAYACPNYSERMILLETALKFYQKDKDKERGTFMATALQEQIELLRQEKKWEQEFRQEFVDLSVSQVIESHVAHSQTYIPLKVKQTFNVPEKRYWHIEVKTLAKNRAFAELANRIVNKKTPPIGYEPFIDACVEQKAPHEAVRYIHMLPDPHEQMEWLCNIQMWKEAADIAMKERDLDALHLIRARCGTRNAAMQQQIDRMIQQFK